MLFNIFYDYSEVYFIITSTKIKWEFKKVSNYVKRLKFSFIFEEMFTVSFVYFM